MINITSLSFLSFKIEDAVLPKLYNAYINRQNIVVLRHVYTAQIIELDIISNILLDGFPTTLEDLKQAIYNYSCACSGSEDNPTFKIFDYTFDFTFE